MGLCLETLRAQSYGPEHWWYICPTDSGCHKHAVEHVHSTQGGGSATTGLVPRGHQWRVASGNHFCWPVESFRGGERAGKGGTRQERRGSTSEESRESSSLYHHTLCYLLGQAARHRSPDSVPAL